MADSAGLSSSSIDPGEEEMHLLLRRQRLESASFEFIGQFTHISAPSTSPVNDLVDGLSELSDE
jgi:hypothetical protein